MIAMNNRITHPQPMHPHGVTGRLFGRLMEWGNRASYDRCLELLQPQPTDTILEIGFGTGRLLCDLAESTPLGMVAGIDPSALMLEIASKRLNGKGGMHDLQLGKADRLPWQSSMFDHVAALHCFQFWADPVATLMEANRVLKREGQLVLILRDHENNRDRSWLPNPWSRHPQETAAAVTLLQRAGFTSIIRHPNVGSSHVITARKPG
ncbi:MAG: methyltransferase domain-containing protein [Rhizobiales bacterium]|nr:methyltransferase domain-containing protein [Hyphomicrobiales bacterium]